MGTERENLGEKSPIVEAVVDIQASLPDGVDVEALRALHAEIRELYPRSRARQRWERKLEFKAEGGPQASDRFALDGWLFYSSDQKDIVQFRLDGFTYNRLRPYESWARLRKRAHDAWEVYQSHARPIQINRLGLRYINRLEIPEGSTLDDYLAAPPRRPPGLPEIMLGFLSRVEFVDPEIGAIARLTQANEKPRTAGRVSILLDIDVYRIQSLQADDNAVWEILDRFSEFTDEIFFQSITENMLNSLKASP